MRKISNFKGKKAQEGVSSIGVLVSIAVIAVLGIALILFIYRGSSAISDTADKISPSALESVIQGCKLNLNTGSYFSYCRDFKTITFEGSNNQGYVNCAFEDVQISLEKSDVDTSAIDCNGLEEAEIWCGDIKQSNTFKNGTKIYYGDRDNPFVCTNDKVEVEPENTSG